MRAELGLAVKVPPATATATAAKSKPPRAAVEDKQRNGHAASKKTSASAPHKLPSQSSVEAPKKNHKARLRERMRKQKAAKQAAQRSTSGGNTTSAEASSGDEVSSGTASSNRNTQKNKRKRAKEKAARQAKAALKASGVDVSNAALATTAQPAHTAATATTDTTLTIDPSIRNSTKRVHGAVSKPESAVPDKERLVAAQQLSEANAAKFGAIAGSFDSGQKWYQHPQCVYTPHSSSSPSTIVLSSAQQQRVQQMREKAQALLTAYSRSVQEGRGEMTREDERWLKTVMSAGTLSDKIAGMQLLLSDRCVGRLEQLDRLLSMAQKKGRRESSMAVDALKEVFTSELMPPDRPLVFFSHQPALLSPSASAAAPSDATLMYWLYEDYLKRAYTALLAVLEAHLHDPMSYIKKHALNSLFSLLSTLPEREKTVLSLLINKLGDPDRRIASRVVYLLTDVLSLHPGMRTAVVREVEGLLKAAAGRVNERGRYYAIIYLSQLRFQSGGADLQLARYMIQVYFNVFAHEISKVKRASDGGADTTSAAGINSKILGALLTGINRAMPFARSEADDGGVVLTDGQIDQLFALTHTASFHTAVQSLMLLYQLVADDTASPLAARYYRALYALLLSWDVQTASARFGLFLNLLYRSMKSDCEERRVMAFVKRLLQVCTGMGAGFVCGSLYLVSEVCEKHGGVRVLTKQTDMRADEEEEHFDDVKEEEEGEDGQERRVAEEESKSNGGDDKPNGRPSPTSVKHRYDPHKRDPLFTLAHHSALWELTVLLSHYHPSVTHWSSLLLSHQPIHYAGDPLTDFTPAAFLDRFVFKNPKQGADGSRTGRHLQRHSNAAHTAATAVLVSSGEFLRKRERDVREDERFYWLYFKEKERREAEGGGGRQRKKKEKGGAVEDEEAAMDEFADRIMEAELAKGQRRGDDEEEEELLKALRAAKDEQGDEEEEEEEEESEGGELTEEMLAEMDGLQGLDGLDDDEQLDDADEEDGEDDDDAEAEAEAAAELGLDDDDDIDMPTFSDEDSDEDDEAAEEEDGEEEEEEASNRTKKKQRLDGKKRVSGLGSDSVFASAEEFASLLAEGADETAQHRKEKMREFTHDRADMGGRRSRGGGGGRGRGGGGRGRGGGKRRK